jgi:hypothetical protein
MTSNTAVDTIYYGHADRTGRLNGLAYGGHVVEHLPFDVLL